MIYTLVHTFNCSDVSEPIVFNPYGELDDWFYAPMFTATLEDKYVVMEHEMVQNYIITNF